MRTHKDSSPFRRGQLTYDLLFLLPQLLLFTLLTIVPFIVAIPIALTDQVDFLDQSVRYVGLRNFFTLFAEPIRNIFVPALGRTSLFTVLNYATVYLFGFSAALVMYEVSTKLSRLFFVVVFLPFMLSGLGVGMFLQMLFSRDSGSLNLLLMSIGVLDKPIDIMHPAVSSVALPLMVGWRYAGFNMALFLTGLLSIPVDTIDASRVDGVSYPQRVSLVYLPQMVPSIIVATIFCIIGSFGIVEEPIGMGGLLANKNAEYLAVVLYKFGFGGGASSTAPQSGTLAQALAMSITVYVPLILVAFFLTRLQRKLSN